jgi:uncharacterized membrane protein YfcA
LDAWRLLLGFAGSFAAGYLGAMLGLVLGTLRLPLILVAAGSTTSGAGTNIAISAAAAGSGAAAHWREGRVDRQVLAWMAPPSMIGAVLGALFGDDAPRAGLFTLIAAVLVWSGIDLALRPIAPRPREHVRLWPAAVFGFGIGLIGGAVGVILGTLRMPALLRAVGMDVRIAAGTNLAVGFLLGLAAFATYATGLDVDWPLLAVGLAGGIPGAWLGAKATGHASERTLRLALGVVLVAVGVVFAVEAVLSL